MQMELQVLYFAKILFKVFARLFSKSRVPLLRTGQLIIIDLCVVAVNRCITKATPFPASPHQQVNKQRSIKTL